jgi:hypothetical protein
MFAFFSVVRKVWQACEDRSHYLFHEKEIDRTDYRCCAARQLASRSGQDF